jgi:hypothetical protein
MKQFVAAALAISVATITISAQGRGGARAGNPSAASAAPQLKFHVEEDFFKWPTNVWPSEAVGVALNSQRHIFC